MNEPNFKSDIAKECFKDLCDSAERDMFEVRLSVPTDDIFASLLKLAIHKQTMIENAWSTAADIEAKLLISSATCIGIFNGDG